MLWLQKQESQVVFQQYWSVPLLPVHLSPQKLWSSYLLRQVSLCRHNLCTFVKIKINTWQHLRSLMEIYFVTDLWKWTSGSAKSSSKWSLEETRMLKSTMKPRTCIKMENQTMKQPLTRHTNSNSQRKLKHQSAKKCKIKVSETNKVLSFSVLEAS